MESIVGYRLSPRQRHLWALLQGEALRARDARALVRLRGPLDETRLRVALDRLVARHEVLRTSFDRLPGMPEALQVVGGAELRWEEAEELRGLSAEERGARVAALWSGEADGQEPLPTARLLRVADGESLLLLRVHALSADAASLEHLVRELAALYAVGPEGEPFPEEPIPYLAVSEWLNEVLSSEEAQAGRAYWVEQCEGSEALLPVERDSPAGEPAFVRRALSSAVLASLGALAARADAAPETVLLAAWKALLHRLSGAGRVRVGVAFDGRTDDELRGAVGPLTQHLPLTSEVGPELTFGALLEHVRSASAEAAGWQECFDALGVHRFFSGEGDASEGTLQLRTGFSLLPGTRAHAAGEVELTLASRRVAGDPFVLHLLVEDGGAGVELRGDATFSGEELDRILERYEALLVDALARPEAPAGTLAVMSGAERSRLLVDFNETPARCAPEGGTLHALFELQAARTPEAPAVRFGAETLSYAELNRRANRLAHHLRASGIGPEARVGIMLPSSPERVEAVLAVLKAGGAYVPLDPSYPHDRLGFMIRDAGLARVLTRSALRERVPEVEGVPVAVLEDVADAIASAPDGNPEVPLAPPAAAYVIYTSGSTGTPKGVLVEHRALTAHALAVRAHYGLGEGDRILQFASFNFDASVEQMLPPLASGACVVLRGEEVLSTEAIGRYVSEAGLTILNLPTAQWHVLAEEWARGDSVPDTRSLRLVIAGGEAMLPRAVGRWQETPARGVRLLNAYGPTETVVTASTFDVPAGLCASGTPRRVPIGRPFGNRSAYVLDERMEPLPIGLPGELYLGGEVLARGYLGRPELTAERFVPDPFSPEPGARLYRTGDLARYGEDGTLAFLGRTDQQVKVRGFRIEPGEVEAALDRHGDVRQSAVVVEEREAGEKQLVAYWVPRDERIAEPDELRAFLRERLPDYMVPGLFVALRTMPLTAVGKVDRRKLATERRIQVARPYVAPSTPLEEEVAAIWGEVMGQERVSMDDNFFALGGHSLLATQLTSRLRKHFGIELPVGAVFDAAVVADLARAVEERVHARGSEEDPLDTITRASREGRRMRASELASLAEE